MNRSARRPAGRRDGHIRALCPPGQHAFAEVVATAKGALAAKRVICTSCRRTFQQVMDQSPDDLRLYREWLEAEIRAARGLHLPACPRLLDRTALPSDGCPGCAQEAALSRADREVGSP